MNPYGPPQQPSSGGMPPQPPYPNTAYPQQPNKAPFAPGTAWGATSIGLDPSIAAGIAYLIPLAGVILYVIEKTNRFVRFHAAQSMVLSITGGAVWVMSLLIGAALGTLAGILSLVLYLGILALFVWGAFAGFTGRYLKLPVLGDFAEQLANRA